jgi:hypothetical protein
MGSSGRRWSADQSANLLLLLLVIAVGGRGIGRLRVVISRDKHEKASQDAQQGRRRGGRHAPLQWAGGGPAVFNRDEMEQGRREPRAINAAHPILLISRGGRGRGGGGGNAWLGQLGSPSIVGASMAGRPPRRCDRNSQSCADVTVMAGPAAARSECEPQASPCRAHSAQCSARLGSRRVACTGHRRRPPLSLSLSLSSRLMALAMAMWACIRCQSASRALNTGLPVSVRGARCSHCIGLGEARSSSISQC